MHPCMYETGRYQVAAKKSVRPGTVELADKRGADKNATLTITTGCFAGLSINLRKERTTLGRDLGCDVCLDDSLASNEHATIVKTSDGFYIEDLNSRNGTSVNGKEVHQKKLGSGDIISIGNFRIKFSSKKKQ
jgi:pSer/pThr/pTyr-binding forkhead associated (FHA) protein